MRVIDVRSHMEYLFVGIRRASTFLGSMNRTGSKIHTSHQYANHAWRRSGARYADLPQRGALARGGKPDRGWSQGRLQRGEGFEARWMKNTP